MAATPLHAGQNNIFRYAFALVTVALALGVALLTWHFGIRHQFSMFLIATAVIAWYCGAGPATLGVVCSLLAYDYFFREPAYSFSVSPADIPNYVLSILFTLLVVWFGTVRRRTEDALRASEKQYRELIDASPDAIFVFDAHGRWVLANASAARLRGCSENELIGLSLADTYVPAERNLVQERLERVKKLGVLRYERQFLRKNNEVVPVEISMSTAGGDQYQTVARDISERKKAEEALRRSHDELETRVKERTAELRKTNDDLQFVNKELEAFAYSVSHDLRAPVRHIAGFTELLQKHADPVLDDKSRRHIRMILDSANRMGSLVDDLLAFSRIGRAETQKTTINLEQLVRDVVREIVPDTQGRNISWRIGNLPICYGDTSMFRLVFANLISNAVKFTRTREQALIEIGSFDHSPVEMVVFVKDNGVGFDMKYKDKLFGVFQRLHSQEAFEGTGIGLATVQRIIHRHGGRVWAEGSINNGATFYVALPKP
jgi:PAS domain S-box-containing protein